METYHELCERHLREKLEYWQSVLQAAGGNVTLAAQMAGYNRTTLHRLLRQLSVERPRLGNGAWRSLRAARQQHAQ